MYRTLELDEQQLFRCHAIISASLSGERHLTRTELSHELKKEGIPAEGQRLSYILMHAELEALICSGPRRDKQFTYALLEERVPVMKTISHDDALAELARRYFTSHGPARLKDFAWWSGLGQKDAAAGLNAAQKVLVEETIDGKTYWRSPVFRVSRQQSPIAWLLSIYDEYTIAYRDRSALGGERYVEKLLQMGNALTAVLVLDGTIAGTWRRVIKKDTVEVHVSPFRKLNREEDEALLTAVRRYGKFLQKTPLLIR
jgi:hypothetical protein